MKHKFYEYIKTINKYICYIEINETKKSYLGEAIRRDEAESIEQVFLLPFSSCLHNSREVRVATKVIYGDGQIC